MVSIRLLTRPEPYHRSRLVFMGLLVVVFSLLTAAPSAVAQEQKTYLSQKYGFAFQYPSTYDLKVTADCYIDFKKGIETSFSLRVDDRFIEMLYQMLHPDPPGSVIIYPGGKNPYQELAQETRNNEKLFHLYTRQEAQSWCVADGPDGSNYCQDIDSEKPFTSLNGFNCLELYPVMIRENFADNTKQQGVVGPLFGVFLPKENLPLVLFISARYGHLASPTEVQDMRQVVDALKLTP
jgi:hypothetical protein